MTYTKRAIETSIQKTLKRGKSILLLGPRQTGKTTLASQIPVDLTFNLMNPQTRQHYETNPTALIQETEFLLQETQKSHLLIFIDEIQKCPILMDAIQVLIDTKKAQFILTGSSVRKLTNLLPGRVIKYTLGPYSQTEYPHSPSIEDVLINGSLPGIVHLKNPQTIQEELQTYISTYLEEEIRKEALVRNLAAFSNFLTLACIESGNLVSFRKFSQDLGIAHSTIAEYYRILESCMIVKRFDPITSSSTRKRLTKSSKFILFDLGIRRVGAAEGTQLSQEKMGQLFEQWVGLQLNQLSLPQPTSVHFWRDHNGPEVDWIIKTPNALYPIEVKWKQHVTQKDAQHLITFMNEYPNSKQAFIICKSESPYSITETITALPWKMLTSTLTATLKAS